MGQAIVAPVKFFEATISGATVAHLGKKHLETIEVVFPDNSWEIKMHQFNQWLDLKMNLASQNIKLKQSRDILLPRLMNGTISIEEAEEKFALAAEPLEVYNK